MEIYQVIILVAIIVFIISIFLNLLFNPLTWIIIGVLVLYSMVRRYLYAKQLKDYNEKVEKSENDPIINMPIIILTNENTASSSEILAGALKDLGKAKTCGTTTYGKGVIQQLLTLPDGSGIKITSEEYLTPNRTKINEIGIEPDEKVELPDTVTNVLRVEEKDDTQLQKAIEMLK